MTPSFDRDPLDNDKQDGWVERKLRALFAIDNGFGAILLYWLVLCSFVAAIALIAAGLFHWVWWLLLLGMMTVKLLLYICRIGKAQLEQISPCDW